jgi:hypothetical protein
MSPFRKKMCPVVNGARRTPEGRRGVVAGLRGRVGLMSEMYKTRVVGKAWNDRLLKTTLLDSSILFHFITNFSKMRL